jgi:hypothetical protein
MIYFLKSVVYAFIIFFIVNLESVAQPYGELFTKQQAHEKFGPTLSSFPLPRISFEEFLTRTNNYIMFKIKDNQVIVLDSKRNLIFPERYIVNTTDEFVMYSVSVIYELLSKGNENTVYIEERRDVLTISNSGYTMEIGVRCPPICD